MVLSVRAASRVTRRRPHVFFCRARAQADPGDMIGGFSEAALLLEVTVDLRPLDTVAQKLYCPTARGVRRLNVPRGTPRGARGRRAPP